jgi:restriction system protein
MGLWLVRAGKHGEYEQRFLGRDRIFLTWDGLNRDLTKGKDRRELRLILREVYTNASEKTLINNAGQIWAFVHGIQIDDWIILPQKTKATIAVAQIIGPYEYHPNNEDPFFHSHRVKWLATDVPRSAFDQDLLYSLGAFLTICKIERNDAEKRVRAMAKTGWKSVGLTGTPDVADEAISIERLDEITLPNQSFGNTQAMT